MSELVHIISRCGEFEGFVGSAVLKTEPKFRPIRQVALISVLDGITKPLDWVQAHWPIGETCLAVGPKNVICHHIYPLPDGYMPTKSYPTCAVKIVTEISFWHQQFSPDVYHAVYKHLYP